MMNCQSRMKSVEHSGENAPERFNVTRRSRGRLVTRIECLAHAQVAEEQGYQIEIILT